MSRPHISQASNAQRRTYEEWLGGAGGGISPNQTGLPAEHWMNAASYAYSCGFDVDPPPTPTLAELDRLRAAGDTAGVARIYSTRRTQLESERHARKYYDGLAGWRASKPAPASPVPNPDLPASLESAGSNAETRGPSVVFKSNTSTREASE
jgi:hypothetical protein